MELAPATCPRAIAGVGARTATSATRELADDEASEAEDQEGALAPRTNCNSH